MPVLPLTTVFASRQGSRRSRRAARSYCCRPGTANPCPTHTEIHRQPAANFPVVLRERTNQRVLEVESRNAERLGELDREGRRVGRVEREFRTLRERVGAGKVVEERDEAPRPNDVDAALELMRAADDRELIDPLRPLLDQVLRIRRVGPRVPDAGIDDRHRHGREVGRP